MHLVTQNDRTLEIEKNFYEKIKQKIAKKQASYIKSSALVVENPNSARQPFKPSINKNHLTLNQCRLQSLGN